MCRFCEQNQQHPAKLSETERAVFETYRDRQLDAPFIDRETSSLLDIANALLDADKAQQCPYQGRELWEMRTDDQGRRILVPLN